MLPGVVLSWPATPSLPLAPRPVGNFTLLPAPTLSFQVGLIDDRYCVNTAVVPLPSERYATEIGSFGNFASGFSFLILGSFQVLTSPRKIPASTSGESFRPVMPGRLYETTTAPSVVGMWISLPGALPSSSSLI